MITRKSFSKSIVWVLLLVVAGVVSCKKETVTPADNSGSTDYTQVDQQFYGLLQDWYLWYDKIPAINPDDYSDPSSLLDAVRYDSLDKWSYVTTQAEFNQYFNEGVFIGYGFRYGLYTDGSIRVVYLYRDSPLRDYGVERGWKMLKINGTTVDQNSDFVSLLGDNKIGVSNEFTFESPDGKQETFTVAKRQVKINTVLYADTLSVGNELAGHIVFEGFIGPSVPELDSAFNFFASQHISDLILDLRYNGGGSLGVALYLSSLIAGNRVGNQVFAKLENNDKHTDQNEIMKLDTLPNLLDINRIFILTSGGTASASEMVVNCLKPYMDVKLIGSTTYGKPVGMYTFTMKGSNLAFVPICFRLLNADDQGNYFNGIPVDIPAMDDFARGFGDPDEAGLHAALYYIENGTAPPVQKRGVTGKPLFNKIKGLQFEIGAI
jgi:C-terminal processing protease CtpA/Prc